MEKMLISTILKSALLGLETAVPHHHAPLFPPPRLLPPHLPLHGEPPRQQLQGGGGSGGDEQEDEEDQHGRLGEIPLGKPLVCYVAGLFNRPGVAGAVLHKPLLLINILVALFLQAFITSLRPNRKS